jgi:hypothetical protein
MAMSMLSAVKLLIILPFWRHFRLVTGIHAHGYREFTPSTRMFQFASYAPTRHLATAPIANTRSATKFDLNDKIASCSADKIAENLLDNLFGRDIIFLSRNNEARWYPDASGSLACIYNPDIKLIFLGSKS